MFKLLGACFIDSRTSIAYPVSLSGAGYPNTFRNPGMACSDPTAARSNPYCIFAMETRQHNKRHFRFCHSVVDESVLSMAGESYSTTQALKCR